MTNGIEIDGSVLVGAERRIADAKFRSIDPASGETFGPGYSEAGAQDIEDACALAQDAAETFGGLAPDVRARFIEAVAEHILAIGEPLIATAASETGLPRARLEGELGRTAAQLRLFADEVRRGEWLDATLDSALPDRVPPRPALGRINLPLGPVVVFGASNFPLAFSVAGGDTASAFAAGCPVIVKGHRAHPGTGELAAHAIRAAVQQCGLPEGVFSYLAGTSHQLGSGLVSDPRVKAVGFTGSRRGGLALVELAASRPEPIPVFAEMSSINPVIIMPNALAARAEAIASGFAASLTMGVGQFCTNPGLILALDGPDLDRFIEAVSRELTSSAPGVMLTPGIHNAYARGVADLEGHGCTRRVAGSADVIPLRGSSALFETCGADFLREPGLQDEVFGPSSLLVRCTDMAELRSVLASLEGQLTATIQFDPADEADVAALTPMLAARAGRLLANGWPTGVEVAASMVHGGPFPATSDTRFTSVGTLAMMRFLRPVCFQNLDDRLLPPALQADNPWRIPRRVDNCRG